jgi:hypothetical protein
MRQVLCVLCVGDHHKVLFSYTSRPPQYRSTFHSLSRSVNTLCLKMPSDVTRPPLGWRLSVERGPTLLSRLPVSERDPTLLSRLPVSERGPTLLSRLPVSERDPTLLSRLPVSEHCHCHGHGHGHGHGHSDFISVTCGLLCSKLPCCSLCCITCATGVCFRAGSCAATAAWMS